MVILLLPFALRRPVAGSSSVLVELVTNSRLIPEGLTLENDRASNLKSRFSTDDAEQGYRVK